MKNYTVLLHWCVGALVHWCIGALVHWRIGALACRRAHRVTTATAAAVAAAAAAAAAATAAMERSPINSVYEGGALHLRADAAHRVEVVVELLIAEHELLHGERRAQLRLLRREHLAATKPLSERPSGLRSCAVWLAAV